MSTKPIPTPVKLGQYGRLSFLLRDSTLYGGAAAISKAFALITFPLLARHFSVVEYGVVDFFLILAGFLTIFFIFGQDSAVARYFYEHDEPEKRRRLISQSLFWQLFMLALLLPIFWWQTDWITSFLIQTPDAELLLRLVLAQLPFLVIINFSRNVLKWTFARAKFLTMSLGFTAVQAVLLLVAVLLFDTGVQGVLLVGLGGSALFGFMGLYLVRQWLVWPTDLGHLREMLPFALPYGIVGCMASFLPTLERSLTNQMLGGGELGLYAAGTKIAMLIGLVVSAFQTAWGPFSLSLYKQPDAAQTFNWVLKAFSLGVCSLVFVLALVAQPVIILLASERYAGAAIVVFPLAMGLAIQATSWITEIGIGISKRSYLHLYSYFIFVAVSLGTILLLTPVFGLLGVALGVMAGQIAKALISSWLAQKAYPLPWAYGPVVWLFLFSLAVGLTGVWAGSQFGSGAYTIILTLGVVSILVLGWQLLFNSIEKRGIRAAIRRRMNRNS